MPATRRRRAVKAVWWQPGRARKFHLEAPSFTRTPKDNELRLDEAEFDAFMGEVHRRAKAAHDFHHATTGKAKATLKSVLRLKVWAVAAAIVIMVFGS